MRDGKNAMQEGKNTLQKEKNALRDVKNTLSDDRNFDGSRVAGIWGEHNRKGVNTAHHSTSFLV